MPDLPKVIIDTVRERLIKRADGNDPNARYQPQLNKGDKVRIDVLELAENKTDRQLYKKNLYKASHKQTYSDKVFTVVIHQKNNMVAVAELKGLYSRGSFLRVGEAAATATAAAAAAPTG